MAKKMLYIGGAYTATSNNNTTDNTLKASLIASWVIEIAGDRWIPFIPHAQGWFLSDQIKRPYEFWIEHTSFFLKISDAALFLSSWSESKGCQIEIDICIDRKIPHVLMLDEEKETVAGLLALLDKP